MHLNTDTGNKVELEESPSPVKRGSAGPTPLKKAVKKKRTSNGLGKMIETLQCSQRNPSFSAEVEEKTSHFVQLDDGTYAEMVEGHEMVAPGHQMLVEDQDGQKLVVVNPAPGDEPQTIVVPEQAETVYVIGEKHSAPAEGTARGRARGTGRVKLLISASQNESGTAVVENQNTDLERMLKVVLFTSWLIFKSSLFTCRSKTTWS